MKLLSFVSSTILIGSFCSTVSGQSIVDLALSSDLLTTLVTAVSEAGLIDTLSDPMANLTVFAPTDEAFGALDPDFLAKLLTPNWKVHLIWTLSHHLVQGPVLSTDITDGLVVDSLLAPLTILGVAPLTFSTDGGVFITGRAFNDSQVISADLMASNGVVHVVDQVFVPAVVGVTDFYSGLGQIPGFATLLGLIEDAELVEFVSTGTYTVFGVPDPVFAGLPAGALDGANITAILLNHFIVGPPLPAALLSAGMNVTTALGVTYESSVIDGVVYIGTVPVVQADLVGKNGIAHVIGGILIPPTPPMEELTTMAPIMPAMAPVTTMPSVMPSAANSMMSPVLGAASAALALVALL